MIEKTPRPTHSVIAGVTTDYLDFWCKECGHEFTQAWRFSSPDFIGVVLEGACEECKATVSFKLRTTPALVPRGYKD